MWDACKLFWSLLTGLFRSRASLEAENLTLRQQIIVFRRTAPKRLRFNTFDRLILVGLHRLFPDLRDALAVVRPETVIRWHRAGLNYYEHLWWATERYYPDSPSWLGLKPNFELILGLLLGLANWVRPSPHGSPLRSVP